MLPSVAGTSPRMLVNLLLLLFQFTDASPYSLLFYLKLLHDIYSQLLKNMSRNQPVQSIEFAPFNMQHILVCLFPIIIILNQTDAKFN